jgi:hypothetical protein
MITAKEAGGDYLFIDGDEVGRWLSRQLAEGSMGATGANDDAGLEPVECPYTNTACSRRCAALAVRGEHVLCDAINPSGYPLATVAP